MRRVLRALAINSAAALFAVVALGGAPLGGSWRAALQNFGISFLFANCIGVPVEYALSALAPSVWRRFRFPLNWALLIGTMATIAVLGSLLAISLLVMSGLIAASEFQEWFLGSLRISLLATLTFGIVITTYQSMRRRLESTSLELRTKQRDEAEARRLAAEARLSAFEARVQPHFLFNTLNSIASLIPNDPAGAEQMVGRLSGLLRASLDPSRSALVPLTDELRTVRDYLEIERVRFGDRLRYELPTTDGLGDIRLPRMAVQTVVENSVKGTRYRQAVAARGLRWSSAPTAEPASRSRTMDLASTKVRCRTTTVWHSCAIDLRPRSAPAPRYASRAGTDTLPSFSICRPCRRDSCE